MSLFRGFSFSSKSKHKKTSTDSDRTTPSDSPPVSSQHSRSTSFSSVSSNLTPQVAPAPGYVPSSPGSIQAELEGQPTTMNPLYPRRTARFSHQKKWQRMSNGEKVKITGPLPTSLQLISWNVDFSSGGCAGRVSAAISHIQRDVLRCKSASKAPQPCVILLQEVHVRAFDTILADEWVRKHFVITPASASKFPGEYPYGCVTLVSKSVPVSYAWSLEYGSSQMGRNALVVDLKMGVPEGDGNGSSATEDETDDEDQATERGSRSSRVIGGKRKEVTLRVANTHLESLPIGAVKRPEQLGLVSRFLMRPGLVGGIVAGDMNAIGPSDMDLARRCGLVDAWSGDDDEEEGYTWGYQPGCEFPPGRLDKVLFTPSGGYDVDEPRKIGVGVKTSDGVWASDHYGLCCQISML